MVFKFQSRNLNYPPAFGLQYNFKNSYVNADAYYRKNMKFDALATAEEKTKKVAVRRELSNLAKIASYYPGLSLFVGIGRVIWVIKHSKDKNTCSQLIRAALEIAQFSLFLAFIDGGKTGYRALTSRPLIQELPKFEIYLPSKQQPRNKNMNKE